MLLEICASNYQSAVNAQEAGAHRVELCSELAVGGITPSYGLLKKVMEELTIPVMVLIRPRSGNFVYSDADFDIMKKDIQLCKELGCAGIVSGILKDDFTVDLESTQALVELAKPMNFTFHRAFDQVSNPEEAIQQLAEIGVSRILTSGQHSSAMEGIENLRRYQLIASDSLMILPGGGINDANCSVFTGRTGTREVKKGFKEIHASAAAVVTQTTKTLVPMNSAKLLQENLTVISNTDQIKAILKNSTHED
jgi:copper homeostasis protein